jgi:hypothetical protein
MEIEFVSCENCKIYFCSFCGQKDHKGNCLVGDVRLQQLKECETTVNKQHY